MLNYGFIGAGNMSGAIIQGMTMGTGAFPGSAITIFDTNPDSMARLQTACGVNTASTLEAVVSGVDILVLGVKPHILTKIMPEVRQALGNQDTLVISIAAARPLADLEAGLGQRAIIRVMPNINAKVGAATCAFCGNNPVTPAHKNSLVEMFSTIGSIDELAEEHFATFTALAGAAPAFAYIYIDSLARAAVKAGLPKPIALKFSAQTVLGSAKMVLEGDEHPWALVDQVCSPGGSTIEGVCALQRGGFEATLTAALDAVIEKDRKVQG